MKGQGPPLLVPTGIPGHFVPQGSHICHFYYGCEHFLVTVGLFLRAALENNEKCFLCLEPELADRLDLLLTRLRVPAAAKPAMVLLDREHVRRIFSSRTTDIQEAIIEKLVEDALGRGFVGVRLVGQIELMLESLGRDRVAFAERLMNQVLPGLPVVMLCEYPYESTSPPLVRELYKVHRPYGLMDR